MLVLDLPRSRFVDSADRGVTYLKMVTYLTDGDLSHTPMTYQKLRSNHQRVT